MLEFEEMDDLNEYVGKFDWCLDNTVEHFTVKSRINREKRNVWFNSELRALRRHKNIKYKKAVMENSIDTWYSYRATRNLYKVKLVNSKIQKI